MAALEAEVIDVGGAGFGHAKAVQPEQDRKHGAVAALRGEQERAQLAAVHSMALARDLGAPDVLDRVRCDHSINMSEW